MAGNKINTMLYLVRHAQSHANIAAKARYPNRTIPLTPYGHTQAKALVATLPKPDKVYVSEMLRTQQSALPFCEHWGVAWEVLPLLNEFSYLPFAAIEGKSRQQIGELAYQYFQRNQPHEKHGDDAFVDFYERVRAFRSYAQRFEGNTLCFGHGVWLQMFYWQHSGKALCDMQAFNQFRRRVKIENASIHAFSCDKALCSL